MPLAPEHPHTSVEAWRRALLQEQQVRTAVRRMPVEAAVSRLLAEDVLAPEDVPALPVAAMDGFAVRRDDLAAPSADGTVPSADGTAPGTGGVATTTLTVAADLPARPGLPAPLPVGRAARIMTGAPIPEGADAVIEVERTDADPYGPCPAQVTLTLDRPVPAGRHIRGRGEEIPRGALLAHAGAPVRAGLVGLAHALGVTEVAVQEQPRVLVVVTGDELADGDTPPADGAVRESNGEMLATALAAWGARTVTARCGDDPQALHTLLDDHAADTDLVLTTGGIGRGAFDVVKAALGRRGRDSSRFAHLALRPGGPQGRGHLSDGTPIVHLPGTPVGALVGAHLFVRPLLDPAAAAHGLGRRIPAIPDDERHPRPDGLLVRPGIVEIDDHGRETVRVLAGRRLAPYGQAEVLVLQGPCAQGEPPETTRILSL